MIFLDIGYTKFCAHACVISKNESYLLDQESLKFTGSRNMDRILIDFYDQIFKSKFHEDLEKNMKSLVKLSENV